MNNSNHYQPRHSKTQVQRPTKKWSFGVLASGLFLASTFGGVSTASAAKLHKAKVVKYKAPTTSSATSPSDQSTGTAHPTAASHAAVTSAVSVKPHHKKHHRKHKAGHHKTVALRLSAGATNNGYQANAQAASTGTTDSTGFTANVPEVSQNNVSSNQPAQSAVHHKKAKAKSATATTTSAVQVTSFNVVHSSTAASSASSAPASSQTPASSSSASSVTTAVSATNNSQLRSNLINTARQYLGDAYVYGATGENNTFDCSGLVQKVYGQNGISMPRVAQDQYNYGQSINETQLQQGDLVFFGASTTQISHVGIYIGNGQMLDAQDNGVIIENIHAPWWNIVGFATVLH